MFTLSSRMPSRRAVRSAFVKPFSGIDPASSCQPSATVERAPMTVTGYNNRIPLMRDTASIARHTKPSAVGVSSVVLSSEIACPRIDPPPSPGETSSNSPIWRTICCLRRPIANRRSIDEMNGVHGDASITVASSDAKRAVAASMSQRRFSFICRRSASCCRRWLNFLARTAASARCRAFLAWRVAVCTWWRSSRQVRQWKRCWRAT
mmetsp:Transcript_5863/g.18483  ORF Transcript_5863/g.18483 Transcript_5863/m.18483 type:complete len:207 (-) Transcript_5863:752-1372(-)